MRTTAGTHSDANSHSNSDPNCNAYFDANSNRNPDSYASKSNTNIYSETYTGSTASAHPSTAPLAAKVSAQAPCVSDREREFVPASFFGARCLR